MRGPTASSRSNPVSGRRGFRGTFSRTSRTGRDLDAQPGLAVLQALPKMHRISIRCRTTAPLSTRHSDLGQVRRGVDIGRQLSIAPSGPPVASWGVDKHCAIVVGNPPNRVPGAPPARRQLCSRLFIRANGNRKKKKEENERREEEKERQYDHLQNDPQLQIFRTYITRSGVRSRCRERPVILRGQLS